MCRCPSLTIEFCSKLCACCCTNSEVDIFEWNGPVVIDDIDEATLPRCSRCFSDLLLELGLFLEFGSQKIEP